MTLRGLIQRPWQVRAFLAGRRTQMRVPMKPQGPMQPECWSNCRVAWLEDGHDGPGLYAWDEGYEDEGSYLLRCPFGAPGTVLAIRETWRAAESSRNDGWRAIEYRADGAISKRPVAMGYWSTAFGLPLFGSWRSPATMPLWAARLRCRVLDIRVHLVREISEGNAEAEGARNDHSMKWPDGDPGTMGDVYRRNFAGQWNGMYGPGSFDRDWCFAATVERLDQEVLNG